MTYNEKKSLYENIMMDVAKIVKNILNESALNESVGSASIAKFIKLADEITKENPDLSAQYAVYMTNANEFHCLPLSFGQRQKYRNISDLVLSELTDDDLLDDGKIYKKNEFMKKYKDSDLRNIPCLVIGKTSNRYEELVIVSYVLPLKESSNEKIDKMRNKKIKRGPHFNSTFNPEERTLSDDYEIIKKERQNLLGHHIFNERENLKNFVDEEIRNFCKTIISKMSQERLFKNRDQKIELYRIIYRSLSDYIRYEFGRWSYGDKI